MLQRTYGGNIGVKKLQNKCVVCGKVDVWIWVASIFKVREAIMLKDAALLLLQGVSDPVVVFGVVKGPNDSLQLSLELKEHNKTMQNTTKPIDYNECVYQREFLLCDTIDTDSEAKHGKDAEISNNKRSSHRIIFLELSKYTTAFGAFIATSRCRAPSKRIVPNSKW